MKCFFFFHISFLGNVSSTIASNLVPVSASLPMMFMPQLGSFSGPALPVVNHGQIVHQQLMSAAPMQTQVIPVFQQQQNIQRVLISQSQPSTATTNG